MLLRIVCKHKRKYPVHAVSLQRGTSPKAWAMKTFHHVIERKDHKKELKKTKTVDGRMVTFGGLVKIYGGWKWPKAIKGAQATAAKCAMLGGHWYVKDPFSGLSLFRALEFKDTETFEEAWTQLKRS